ncbi:hypothetical protein ACHHYP_01889 [Achlya hypogyna]|uniref:Uncharacterized protein n=1 Tax=Achlya hypogyna TaxID=1202772 RepID=A0A1V9Z885_ACHHY|nr:hypothetical protein ACHHYP_01889 [Achlya hypogyna]
MVVRIKVRVFLFPVDPLIEHSYVVGSRPVRLANAALTSCIRKGGLSSVIGMIVMEDDDELTFASVRPRIELQQDGSVQRRNVMYQEALFLMTAGANPHQWPVKALQTYWLGYYTHEDDAVPRIVPTNEEHRSLRDVLDMKTTKVTADLIIIPQSQIGPVCNTVIVAPEGDAPVYRSRIEQAIWEIESCETDDDDGDERPTKMQRIEPPRPAPVVFRPTKRELERAAAKAKALENDAPSRPSRPAGDSSQSLYFAKLTRRKRRLAFDD